MKPRLFSYARVLTPAWIAFAILAALFPGNEHLNQVPIRAPGYLVLGCLPWVRNLSYSGISQYAVPAGVTVVMVLMLAVGLDRLRVRTVVWMRAVLVVAICCAVFWLVGFVQDALARHSFAATAHHWRLDEPGRLLAFPLFCLSSGLLLGSIVALTYGGIEWIVNTAYKGDSADE